ncbi:MAG: hypothetical protein ACR2JY_00475 [Chloroflexota bacterium]
MHYTMLTRTAAAIGLAVILSATVVAQPVNAALPATAGTPPVCAYLGVINGTRRIDPYFAPGAKTSPPAPTPGPLGAGAVLLGLATSSSTTAAKSAAGSNFCHAIPPLAPVRSAG